MRRIVATLVTVLAAAAAIAVGGTDGRPLAGAMAMSAQVRSTPAPTAATPPATPETPEATTVVAAPTVPPSAAPPATSPAPAAPPASTLIRTAAPAVAAIATPRPQPAAAAATPAPLSCAAAQFCYPRLGIAGPIVPYADCSGRTDLGTAIRSFECLSSGYLMGHAYTSFGRIVDRAVGDVVVARGVTYHVTGSFEQRACEPPILPLAPLTLQTSLTSSPCGVVLIVQAR